MRARPSHASTVGVSLPYPQAALGLEVAFVFLFALMEWGRLSLGELPCLDVRGLTQVATGAAPSRPAIAASTGNRLEAASQLLASLALAAPVVVFHVYYMRLQTYVCVVLHATHECAGQNTRRTCRHVSGHCRLRIAKLRRHSYTRVVAMRRLRLELVINAIALAFTSLEALLTAFGVSRLWQARRY